MSEATRWPDASAYAAAARVTESFFANGSFAGASLARSPLGIPLPATGRNAAVFKASLPDGDVAIRVFTRPPSEGPERYGLIDQHLQSLKGNVFPWVRWHSDAVAVNGARWPVVEMDWVEGRTLDEWVRTHLGDADRLSDFVERWDRLFVYLDHSHVAHGDLQHGNVLVEDDDTIRLVDLDGIWLPDLDSMPAGEFGHAHFQHPSRVVERVWGPRMDGFAALVIGVTIAALACRPSLWDAYNDGGNNLIFVAEDFADLDRPIWRDLEELEDDRLQSRIAKLRRACLTECSTLTGPVDMLDDTKPDPEVPGAPIWLRGLLVGEESASSTAKARSSAPDSDLVPWWVIGSIVALIIAVAVVLVVVLG